MGAIAVCWSGCGNDIALLEVLSILVPGIAGIVEAWIQLARAPRWTAVIMAPVVALVFAIFARGAISVETVVLALLAAAGASGGYSWVRKVFEGLAARTAAQEGKTSGRGG